MAYACVMFVPVTTCGHVTGGASSVEQAVGRLVGALCVVTGKDEDAESAMLASWVSQVSRLLMQVPPVKA